MDRIVFGDNQFFGINHWSEEKARAQAMKFQDIRAVINVLDISYDEGIKTFMCTTHERIAKICDHIRAHPSRYPEFVFYPCMPYAYTYANAVTEYGAIEALRRFLPNEGTIQAAFQGSVSFARKEITGIIKLLIDAEMKMFNTLCTPVIFLQNVVVDLLLGLGFNEAFCVFADHVKQRYGSEPGFITMNLPKLVPLLEELGIENPIICSNINKIGFRMCGGRDQYERVLAENRFRAIAMSVFASGAIPPKEALEYVCGLKQVSSIVFGASSRANIRQTKDLIRTISDEIQ